MTDFLYNLDLQAFYFINHTIANPLFDKFFPFITEIKNWYLTYIILWLILFFKGGRIGKITAIVILLAITVSDQISSHFIKDMVARIRPCNALPDVRALIPFTDSYSFPSSHAVNNFTIAVLLLRIFPKLKWVLLISAFLIAFSRPYVGVHYPSDIIGGAIIGSIIGYIFSYIIFEIEKWFNRNKKTDNSNNKFERIKELS
jgi:undecaprenyl-diphosphatase